MTSTWEVTHERNGALDEVFVHHARRVVLCPGIPGRWGLVIELAEEGRLVVDFHSAHGIRGTFDLDELPARSPWPHTDVAPHLPSRTARYRADTHRNGRLVCLEVGGLDWLHVERMQREVFWMAMSLPSGDLLVSRLCSVTEIAGEPRHEPAPDSQSPQRRSRRLLRQSLAASRLRPAHGTF